MHDVEGRAGEEPGVGTVEFEAEAHEWIPDQVDQEEIAIAQAFLEAARDPEYEYETDQICYRLIEKQRLEAHAVRVECQVVVGWDAMRCIDTQAPGQRGWWPIEFL